IDRALRAARLAEAPLLIAESQRLLSAAYRRAGRSEEALEICAAAADQLRRSGEARIEMRAAEVLCTASYSAAKSGDRERAKALVRDLRQARPDLGHALSVAGM